jgi:hypothetical protein
MKVDRGLKLLASLALSGGLAGCGSNLDLGLGGSDLNIPLPCAIGSWAVRGFGYQHFTSSSDALLTATIRRNETVRLTLTTLQPSNCDDKVSAVQWVSTAPGVAGVESTGLTTADLTGIAPGETRVSAEVTFSDGTRRTAELHAVPSAGSPVLRVYAVRVVR